MGKFNEIQEEVKQSYGSNSFTTTVKENTVEFDSAKDSFTFKDEVDVPSLSVGGEAFAGEKVLGREYSNGSEGNEVIEVDYGGGMSAKYERYEPVLPSELVGRRLICDNQQGGLIDKTIEESDIIEYAPGVYNVLGCFLIGAGTTFPPLPKDGLYFSIEMNGQTLANYSLSKQTKVEKIPSKYIEPAKGETLTFADTPETCSPDKFNFNVDYNGKLVLDISSIKTGEAKRYTGMLYSYDTNISIEDTEGESISYYGNISSFQQNKSYAFEIVVGKELLGGGNQSTAIFTLLDY